VLASVVETSTRATSRPVSPLLSVTFCRHWPVRVSGPAVASVCAWPKATFTAKRASPATAFADGTVPSRFSSIWNPPSVSFLILPAPIDCFFSRPPVNCFSLPPPTDFGVSWLPLIWVAA
jgi:hypothetical protein